MRFAWLWSARDLTWTRRVDPGPIGRRTLWDRGASFVAVRIPWGIKSQTTGAKTWTAPSAVPMQNKSRPQLTT
jgi:hypothetical protein